MGVHHIDHRFSTVGEIGIFRGEFNSDQYLLKIFLNATFEKFK